MLESARMLLSNKYYLLILVVFLLTRLDVEKANARLRGRPAPDPRI